MYCNPDVCPNCMYIGEGDSFCDVIQEIVLADWSPTEHYMGPGCPYRLPAGKKKRHRKPEALKAEMNRDVSHMTPAELAEAATYVRKGWKNQFGEELCLRAGLHQKYLESYGDKTREIVQRAAKSFNIRMI